MSNIIVTLLNTIISLVDVLVVLLPMLLSVAFMTIIERKQLAAHQRIVGPNYVGKGKKPSKDLCLKYFFIACHPRLSNNNNDDAIAK